MIAIYARTAAGGDTAVEAQIERCMAVLGVAAAGVRVYRDVNVSGVGPVPPGLTALLAAVEAGEVERVVAADWARFGRTPERVAQVRAVAALAGCPISIAEARG